MKKITQITAIFMAGALTFSLAGCVSSSKNESSVETDVSEEIEIIEETPAESSTGIPSDVVVGDYVTFGTYEQDNNTANGAEAIEWRVLAVEDGKALLISRYALDCQPYNETDADVTWETCTLRTWLNNDFYNTAFSSADKSLIQTTNVVNKDTCAGYAECEEHNELESQWGNEEIDIVSSTSEGGNDTSDNVFLLSLEESKNYFDYTHESLTELDGSTYLGYSDLQCSPTDYAKAQGASQSRDYTTSDGVGTCLWWLRSVGSEPGFAVKTDYAGGFSDYNVNYAYDAVRPAVWVAFS